MQAEAYPMTVDAGRTLVLGLGNTLLQDEGVGVHVIGELVRLARISHHPSTAAADMRAVTGRAPSSRLDVVSATPAPSSGPRPPSQRHLDALATNGGEICGLDPDAPRVDYLDGGTLSFTLAGPIGEADALIVVDTAQLDSEPGTVRVFEGRDMDAFVGNGRKTSVHEVSLRDVLAISSLEGRLPARRALVGIQPGVMDWGNEPTPAVAAAIPRACEAVRDLLERWIP